MERELSLQTRVLNVMKRKMNEGNNYNIHYLYNIVQFLKDDIILLRDLSMIEVNLLKAVMQDEGRYS
jgi:hypothetical protein